MSEGPHRAAGFDTDLVEYLVVAVPTRAQLTGVASALAELAVTGQMKILDVVVTARDAGTGQLRVLEVDEVDRMSELASLAGALDGLLSEHDIELAASAVAPGSVAVLVLAESRWAVPLAQALHRVGGGIVGGERIPRSRVEAAVARPEGPETGREPG